jgi:GNAT superfamily N-acetyltransferase
MHTQSTTGATADIRPLFETDLDAADRIFRLAFGTFVGLPDPLAFMGDADLVRTRWRSDRSSAFGAYVDGGLAGSNFATNWGTVGFFGPLTVRPDLWDAGLGKRLMEPVIEVFEAWGTRNAGLFTFPHSLKHVGLYQRFGFWPQFLTAVMAKPVTPTPNGPLQTMRFSEVAANDRDQIVARCRAVSDAVYEGLDVTSEIRAVADQRLGDTVLLWRDDQVIGFAVCHTGAGTEAGSGACYAKFAAVRPTGSTGEDFDTLLSALEQFACERGTSRVVAGVNTAREEAYRRMLAHGFRTEIQGVAMQRPNEPGYNRAGMYVIDDWR